jgi:hypothetical protein
VDDAEQPPEGADESTPPDEPDSLQPHEHAAAEWPRRQVYFVTIEWQDDPHQPETPEQIARAIRQVLEHAHSIPPEAPPARFSVRVKADDIAVELEGKVVHHHHHH